MSYSDFVGAACGSVRQRKKYKINEMPFFTRRNTQTSVSTYSHSRLNWTESKRSKSITDNMPIFHFIHTILCARISFPSARFVLFALFFVHTYSRRCVYSNFIHCAVCVCLCVHVFEHIKWTKKANFYVLNVFFFLFFIFAPFIFQHTSEASHRRMTNTCDFWATRRTR